MRYSVHNNSGALKVKPIPIPAYTTGVPTLEIPVTYTLANTIQDTVVNADSSLTITTAPVTVSVTVPVFMSDGYATDTATAIKNRGISEQNNYNQAH